MKVAIYARVSTDKQNVEQQKQALIEYCRNRGWEYRSYIDDAMTGLIADRPAWQRLMRDVEKRRVDAFLVLKYDRITRDLKYALEFLDWLKDGKYALYSVWDGGLFDFEDPDKEFNFKLNCLLSERELKLLKMRSRIGIERAKREGKYIYGRGRPKPR